MGFFCSKFLSRDLDRDKRQKSGQIPELKVDEPRETQDENIVLLKNEDFISANNKDGTRKRKHGKRPLVVLIAWMTAKDKHLQKFRDLYSQRGFDILTVKMKMAQALKPKSGSQMVAKKLLDYLASSEYKTIVIHAFSVGGYFFGECLILMKNNPAKYGQVAEAIKGQVFDSIIDYQQAKTGIPKTLTNSRVLQILIAGVSTLYLWLHHNTVTKHYIASSRCFHQMFLDRPLLVFASPHDELNNFESIEELVQDWRSHGRDVRCKYWERSGHVQHFVNFPEEYSAELDEFLSKISVL